MADGSLRLKHHHIRLLVTDVVAYYHRAISRLPMVPPPVSSFHVSPRQLCAVHSDHKARECHGRPRFYAVRNLTRGNFYAISTNYFVFKAHGTAWRVRERGPGMCRLWSICLELDVHAIQLPLSHVNLEGHEGRRGVARKPAQGKSMSHYTAAAVWSAQISVAQREAWRR